MAAPGSEGSEGRFNDLLHMMLGDLQTDALEPVEHYQRMAPDLAAAIAELYRDATVSPVAGAAGDPGIQTAPETEEPSSPFGLNRLGPYRILHEVGRGGQGVVYLAQDRRLPRKVALKILSGYGPGSADALERFRREAVVTSRLEHPAICPIYEMGMERGVPFIAMRFIEGESLARKIATSRAGSSGTLTGPDTEREIHSVLSLMEKAARGLHAAHEAKILHRDIKPGNIMVTPEGEPVIMDFGLARDESGDLETLTRTGEVFGTPAYMAPEQLLIHRVRLDRRADLWSLGVCLYECLTLRRPFDAPTREGLYHAIQTKEAQDPRQLNRSIPRDLATVIATTLEKDRDRRYQTAEAFAEDLRRVRQREPILARPVGPLGRILRWGVREPLKAALLLVLLVTIPTIAALATAWVKEIPRREEARLLKLQQEKDENLAEASYELGEGDARRARSLYGDILRKEGSAPEAATGLVLALLKLGEFQAALDELDREAGQIEDRPGGMLLRVDALRALGRPHEAEKFEQLAGKLRPKDALDHYILAERALQSGRAGNRASSSEAVSQAQRAVNLSPSPRLHLWVLLAFAAGDAQDRETAIAGSELIRLRWPRSARGIFAVGYALGHFSDPTLLDEAIAAFREAIRLRPGEALAHHNLGNAFSKSGRLQEAITSYGEAIRLMPTLAMAYTGLGDCLHDQGLFDEAEAKHREAIRIDPGFAMAHSNLGKTLRQKGLLDQAIASHGEAIRLMPNYAEAHFNLGNALVAAGRPDSAIAAYREAIRYNPDYAEAYGNLGSHLREAGLVDEAIAASRNAIRLNPKDGMAFTNLGNALVDKDLLDEAVSAYDEAIQLMPTLAAAYIGLGNALRNQGLIDEAILACHSAIRLKPELAEARSSLGSALSSKGLLDEAEAAHREAIRLKPELAMAHCKLGNVLRDKGLLDKAEAAYREAMRLDARLAIAHSGLGIVLIGKNLPDEGLAAFREAIRLDPKSAAAHHNLGIAALEKGLVDEAIAASLEATRLKPDYAEAHCNLGHAFKAAGRHRDALEAYRRGHAAGSFRPGWRYPSADWVAQAETLVRDDERNERRLAEGPESLAAEEITHLARTALAKGWALAAARWFRRAIELNPVLAEDLRHGIRFQAARCALRAALAAEVSEGDRAGWRRQALSWLSADLETLDARLESGRIQTGFVSKAIKEWQTNSDLASVRGDEVLAALPENERTAWTAFWSRAAQLLGSLDH